MPTRYLKESILRSETVAGLDDFTWRLFVSLIPLADDFGRGKANPSVVKGLVFPLREKVTTAQIAKSLQLLQQRGAIKLYQVGDSSYFYFPTWAKHQGCRAKKSKYPAPNEGEIADNCMQMYANADNCMQMQTNACKSHEIEIEIDNIEIDKEKDIERESAEDSVETPQKAPKLQYGEFKNVLLSDVDLEKLKTEFPTDWERRIEDLSAYMASTGKTYKNHLATIRTWKRLDEKRQVKPADQPPKNAPPKVKFQPDKINDADRWNDPDMWAWYKDAWNDKGKEA